VNTLDPSIESEVLEPGKNTFKVTALFNKKNIAYEGRTSIPIETPIIQNTDVPPVDAGQVTGTPLIP